jgi:3-hydroxy acid dehydrogenase / malonic semialdehyde reductase
MGPRLHALKVDVCDTEGMEEALSSLPKEFSKIDVLVNNAGVGLGLDPADKADLKDWNAMIDTNVKGLVSTTRLVLPGMVARDKGEAR